MRLLTLFALTLTLLINTGCDEVRIKLASGQTAAVGSEASTLRLDGFKIGDDGIDVPGLVKIGDDGIDVPGLIQIGDDGIEFTGTIEVVGDEIRISRNDVPVEAR